MADGRPLRPRWRSTAIAHPGLSWAAKLAACVYAEHSLNGGGWLRYPPSAATLANEMSVSRPTAIGARLQLEQFGFIELRRGRGEKTPSTRLILPTASKRRLPVVVNEVVNELVNDVDTGLEVRDQVRQRGAHAQEHRASAAAYREPTRELEPTRDPDALEHVQSILRMLDPSRHGRAGVPEART